MGIKEFNVKTERFYSAHHTLLRLARSNLETAKTKAPGWRDCQFSSITLSSLAVEAFCNAVGGRVIDNWSDFESCSPIAKTRLISEKLNINYQTNKEPWGSIIWLCKTRNLIAHPKPEPIIFEATLTEQEHRNQEFRNPPQSKLENRMTLAHASKSVEAVEKLIDLFCGKLTPEQNFGIVGDMWSSSSTFHDGLLRNKPLN